MSSLVGIWPAPLVPRLLHAVVVASATLVIGLQDPGGGFNCSAGPPAQRAAWTDRQKVWCCQHAGRGCEAVFDCKANVSNWRDVWSLRKKVWCCQHAGKGCLTTSSPSFDCSEDSSNWYAVWSVPKKVWCCQHENLGCLSTSTLMPSTDCGKGHCHHGGRTTATAQAVSTTTATPSVSAAAPPGTCNAMCSFQGHKADCKAWVHWAAKNRFEGGPNACATAYGFVLESCPACLGCSFTKAECADGGAAPAEVGAPREEPPPTTGRPSSTKPAAAAPASADTAAFNCTAGHSQRSAKWSAAKKAWCCEHEGRGCTEACDKDCVFEGHQASCKLRVQWAAVHRFVGEADPCAASHAFVLRNCPICGACSRAVVGCTAPAPPSTTTASPPSTTTAPSPEVALTVRQQGSPGDPTTTMPSAAYDCQMGLGNWETEWANEKKAWCCQHENHGCVYDCTAGFTSWQTGWSEAKKAWCCREENRGCPAEHYDCATDLATWQTAWSIDKSRWCCSHQGLGCTSTDAYAAKFKPLSQGPLRKRDAGAHHVRTGVLCALLASLLAFAAGAARACRGEGVRMVNIHPLSDDERQGLCNSEF